MDSGIWCESLAERTQSPVTPFKPTLPARTGKNRHRNKSRGVTQRPLLHRRALDPTPPLVWCWALPRADGIVRAFGRVEARPPLLVHKFNTSHPIHEDLTHTGPLRTNFICRLAGRYGPSRKKLKSGSISYCGLAFFFWGSEKGVD